MSQLPHGWKNVTLEDVTTYIQRGKSPKYTESSELPVINQKCVRWWGIDEEFLKFIDPSQWAQWSVERFLRPGDILWNSTGTGTIGRAAIFEGLSQFTKVVVDSHVTIVRCNSTCLPQYLHYYIRSPLVQNRIENMLVGSTNQVELSRTEILKTPIPLPPIAEQRRIVARLDSLLAQSKAARAELNKALALAKRQRQAVLAKAFSGELTQDANFNGKVNALELYNSIREKNIQEGKKKLNHTDAIVSPPFNIPSSWMWTNIGALFDVTIGGTPSRKIPSFWNGDIPWVSSGEVSFQRIQDTREKISQEGLLNSNAKLLPQGTVLLGMIGEGKTRGQAAILDLPATSNQNAAAIMCSKTPIPSEWVYYWLQASYAITRGDGVGGVQPALNSERVRQLLIPLAPLEEQKEIVKRIEAAFAQIETMENEAKKALALAERLEQATLAKAFQGQL